MDALMVHVHYKLVFKFSSTSNAIPLKVIYKESMF